MDKPGRREKQRAETCEEIKRTAWNLLAESDTGSLSLRAIAVEMGLTAPALYRYYPSKNHLLTALVVDAFASLAAWQRQALETCRTAPWQERFRALGRAYREWALGNTPAFLLIFGNPLRGWSAPWEETMPTAGTALTALLSVLQEAHLAGDLKLPLAVPATPGLAGSLAAWSSAIHKVDPEILYLGFMVTTRVQGLMLVELGRQLPPFFPDGSEIYERELGRMIVELAG